MDKRELCEMLDRALEMNNKYFRSFDLWDWLGLSGFSDEEIKALEQPWLDFQGEGNFASWLEDNDAESYRRYTQQADIVWSALRTFTNFADDPSISGLGHARRQLDY